jgi:glycosyltransferase involved in cell wall biosynthesis
MPEEPEALADKSNVLFLTRRFPPSVGGMQTLAADVDRTLRGHGNTVELVALRSDSSLNLAWFLPFALIRTLLARGRATHVLCGDAVVWAAIAPAASLSRAKTAVMVHGLDLVFPNALYQRVIRWALPRAGRVIANSSATKAVACEETGLDPAHIVVVNPRLHRPASGPSADTARAELAARAGLDLDRDTLILITIGRLVRRKGVEWFIGNVFPRLPSGSVYLIVGDGPRRQAIERLIQRLSLEGRVRLLGSVDDDYRELLLRGADICLLPNVAVPGDMEGFGLAAVEAATRGTLVIASAIEGIQDSVIDGVTGIAVEAGNPGSFIEAIDPLARDRELLRRLGVEYQAESAERFTTDDGIDGLLEAVGLDDASGGDLAPA